MTALRYHLGSKYTRVFHYMGQYQVELVGSDVDRSREMVYVEPTRGATKPTSAQTPRDIRRSRLPANRCLLSPLHFVDWPISVTCRPIASHVIMHDRERSHGHEAHAGYGIVCGVYSCSRNMQAADAHSAAAQMRQSHTRAQPGRRGITTDALGRSGALHLTVPSSYFHFATDRVVTVPISYSAFALFTLEQDSGSAKQSSRQTLEIALTARSSGTAGVPRARQTVPSSLCLDLATSLGQHQHLDDLLLLGDCDGASNICCTRSSFRLHRSQVPQDTARLRDRRAAAESVPPNHSGGALPAAETTATVMHATESAIL